MLMKCGSCEQVSQISNQIFFVFRVLYLPIIEYHVNVDTCIYKDNPSFLLERLSYECCVNERICKHYELYNWYVF